MISKVQSGGRSPGQVKPPRLVIFEKLFKQGVFDVSARWQGGGFVDASPVIIDGVGPVTASLLAARGIKTIKKLLASKKDGAALGLQPAMAKTVDTAKAAILAAAAERGINLVA